MSIQAVIFDMYETLVTQFCSPLYYGTQIAEDLGLRPEEFLPGWRATEEARATGRLTFEDATTALLHRHDLSGHHRRVGLADTLLPGEAMGIKIGKQLAFPDGRCLLGEAVGDEADSDAPFPEGRQQG